VVEIGLFVVLAVFTVLAARLLRNTGAVAHWVAGWTAAALAGFLPLLGTSTWPRLQLAAHALGTLYAALLLSGTLLLAERKVPRWLLPAALAYGVLRAIAASELGPHVGYALGLLCEPIAVVVAARVAWDASRSADVGRAERWLGPSLGVLALAGTVHLAWLAAGRSPKALAPLWVVVAPIARGVQIQAAADRLRRRVRTQLEASVAERTEALSASEERYRAISALSTDFAFKVRIDRELRLTREWISGAFARTLGVEPEQIDDRGWIGLLDPAERDVAVADFARGGERPLQLEVNLRRRDGSRCVVQVRLGLNERDADGTVHLLGSGRDVTALKDAEAERARLARHVEQAERLESLGILAGGIAHDFNNLLTVIRGSAKLALADLDRDGPARARVERIATAAEHAAALTEEMLAYAGKSATSLAPLDPAVLVGEMADLLRASVGAHCVLGFELGEDVPPIEGDANGLRRVLMNLVLNASEALGDKPGRITVSTALAAVTQAELDDAFGDGHLAPGRYVALEVRDEGRGMDRETSRRIFEPFFSTKFSGRGLGMAAVLGIVQAHHGVIRVETAPGEGTLVRVLLPPTSRALAVAEAPAPAGTSDGLRVLVVDDDEGVLELAREVLAAAGHRVRTASGGRAAIDLLRADPHAVDVVVLDLTMPEPGGEAVFREARALRADLPVILVTGYDAAHAAGRVTGLDGFLRKPWEPEDLVAAVERTHNGVGPPIGS